MKWSETDLAALRRYYPEGGSPLVLSHLEVQRSVSAIGEQARRIGVTVSGRNKYRNYPTTPHIDDAIRRAYQSGVSGAIKKTAASIGRPYGWVKYRAGVLGLRHQAKKEPAWCEEELAILTEHDGKCTLQLQRYLKRAGYTRSTTSIASKMQREGVTSEDPDVLTASEVSHLLGLDGHVILRWLNSGRLKEIRRGNMSGGISEHRHIHRKHLRKFIIENSSEVNLRKIRDRFWFVDLLGRAT